MLQGTVLPIDFDHNATTPLLPAARAAMAAILARDLGNPASVHGRGQAARAVIDTARAQVARALSSRPGQVVFTSGATEANVLAWRGVRALHPSAMTAVTTAIEHPSVLAVAAQLESEGVTVQRIGVDAQGRLDLPAMAEALAQPDVRLVSIMAVNNELGTVLPVAAVAALARARGILVHCDATQAAGRMALDFQSLGADLASLSGHKFGGPPGVGVLWLRRGVAVRAVQPGHQEQGLRAGTENVIGIAGTGVAAAALGERLAAVDRVRALRDKLWQGLRNLPGVARNGDVPVDEESGHTLNVSFAGIEGAALLMALDLEDVYASSGAACSSGSLEPSHVLMALGDGSPQARTKARGAIRFSLGPENTADEVARVLAILPALLARVRAARH